MRDHGLPADAESSIERRYRYSLPLYVVQILIAIAMIGVLVWALLDNPKQPLEVPGVLVSVVIAYLLWLCIREVYRSPREIIVAGNQVRTVSFGGVNHTFALESLRRSTKRNYLYGSYDVREPMGQLAFRLYVWLSSYKELLDLVRPEEGADEYQA